MWKVLSKHFILFFISLLVLVLVVFPYCAERLVGRIVLNKYLKQEYYLLYNEMKVNYVGNNAHADIRGIHGDRHRWWISAYEIETPFMDRTFEIWVDKNNYKIFGSDFYEQLSYDEKFQHHYSNWLKKQIGLDDENVELYFNRASCGSRNIGENIYIDFRNVISLDNLEEQICENTHNLYIRSNHHEQGADVIINNIDNIKEVLNYADLIEEKIRSRIFIDTKHFMPSENNHLFICILTQKDKNYLDIKYDYDNNVKMYRYRGKDNNWIEYE
jgi:hypothetical protein